MGLSKNEAKMWMTADGVKGGLGGVPNQIMDTEQ